MASDWTTGFLRTVQSSWTAILLWVPCCNWFSFLVGYCCGVLNDRPNASTELYFLMYYKLIFMVKQTYGWTYPSSSYLLYFVSCDFSVISSSRYDLVHLGLRGWGELVPVLMQLLFLWYWGNVFFVFGQGQPGERVCITNSCEFFWLLLRLLEVEYCRYYFMSCYYVVMNPSILHLGLES